MTPDICPNCGAAVPRRAKACPGCGSDESTGWSEEAHASGLGISDEPFDHQAFLEEEFGSRSPKPRGIHWVWWLTAILLLLMFLLFWFR